MLYTTVWIPALMFLQYYYVYSIYIYIHITSYNNFTLLLHLFLEQNILVLNRYVCNFQLQFLHFLETVFHPFMLSRGVFKTQYVQIEHAIIT